MGLNLQIVPLTVPSGTEFPGTVQANIDQNAAYLAIEGDADFNGINFGATEPAPADRDKPWYKTDGAGNPIGWYSWNGIAWTPTPMILPSGTTSDRPTTPISGQIYHDTTIDVTIRWTGGAWTTLAGSPGDLKYVKASSLTDALTKNPGWSHDSDSVNMSLVGASDGSGASDIEYDDELGTAEYMIELENLPSDGINLLSGWAPYSGAFQNGPQGPGVFPIVTGQGTTSTTGPINSDPQVAIPLWQPTLARWCIIKD